MNPTDTLIPERHPSSEEEATRTMTRQDWRMENNYPDLSGLSTRTGRAETRTEQAEARTKQANRRTEQAEARTEQANQRTERAELRTMEAEARNAEAME